MNKLLATMISGMLLSTPALANEAVWQGNSGRLKEGCSFMSNEAGTMAFSEASGEWTVTNPAKLTLKVRDVEAITVAAGTALSVGGEVVTRADVDFRGNDTRVLRGGKALGGLTVDAKSVKVDDLVDSVFTIELGGTVTPADPDFVTSSNTDYRVAHMITCED